MPPFAAAVIALIGLIAIFSAVWAWQLKTGNAGMVDPVWAYSLGLVAVLYAVVGDGDPVSRALTALGGLVWGVRLGTHLWKRNFGKPEDARYRRFREEWGDKAASKMFWFFQVQVVISMLLSIAFLVPSYRSSAPAIGWIVLAVVVWIASVVGEGIADRQLKRFAQNPANHTAVCRVGLWCYSRHPNYFFECMHWLAYIALSIGTPWGWFTVLPPVLMVFLLLKLSGIPLLEESMAKRRAGYADYMRTTSALIPWPPRH
ncbi:UNVERIFIED_ORG: steroid 5-alpha reductase family enzyme [Paraburkholderia sediminicola]|nr:steroid 5-alpha reductase family enzyme [Paraburkholderia sediminicola]